jgi:hypothetical protein
MMARAVPAFVGLALALGIRPAGAVECASLPMPVFATG